MTKPRYRYDWKMGWWERNRPDFGKDIWVPVNPVTEWYRRTGSPVLVELPSCSYGGGGGGGVMPFHSGPTIDD